MALPSTCEHLGSERESRGRKVVLGLPLSQGRHLQNRPEELRGKGVRGGCAVREGFLGEARPSRGAKTAGLGGAVGAEPTPPGPWGDGSPGRAA